MSELIINAIVDNGFDWVQLYGKDIRVHGNGFIQIDLPENHRLHIWGHVNIPKQKRASTIHDHVFGFTSWLLHGSMINVLYETLPATSESSNAYRVYEPKVREGQDTELMPTDTYVHVRETLRQFLYSKPKRNYLSSYHMSPFVFHDTIVVGPTITVIKKHNLTQAEGAKPIPRVLFVRSGDNSPDNDFNRYAFGPDVLWPIVADVFQGI